MKKAHRASEFAFVIEAVAKYVEVHVIIKPVEATGRVVIRQNSATPLYTTGRKRYLLSIFVKLVVIAGFLVCK